MKNMHGSDLELRPNKQQYLRSTDMDTHAHENNNMDTGHCDSHKIRIQIQWGTTKKIYLYASICYVYEYYIHKQSKLMKTNTDYIINR